MSETAETPVLVREQIERRTLERAAMLVEQLSGSEVYMSAFRRAARAIRSIKPD